MNSVTSFLLLIFCVGVVVTKFVSTPIDPQVIAKFKYYFNSNVTSIQSDLSALATELLLQNIIPVPISQYSDNRAVLLSFRTELLNALAKNVSSMRINLLNRIVADYKECYSYVDEQNSILVDALGVLPGCDSVISAILNIFNTGIATCDACFASATGSIFSPFKLNIIDAQNSLRKYQQRGTLCVGTNILILNINPGCYNATDGPKQYYDAANAALLNIRRYINYGNLNTAYRSPCSLTAEKVADVNLDEILNDNLDCFDLG